MGSPVFDFLGVIYGFLMAEALLFFATSIHRAEATV